MNEDTYVTYVTYLGIRAGRCEWRCGVQRIEMDNSRNEKEKERKGKETRNFRTGVRGEGSRAGRGLQDTCVYISAASGIVWRCVSLRCYIA